MKEIDFLPTWYRSGRRRQIGYRTQYAGLGCILVVMLVWNFIAVHSLSKTKAEIADMEVKSTAVKNAAQEFAIIKNETEQLQKKAETLEEIDSKIDIANVLAEISFLVDKKIVLSKVEFIAEKFESGQKRKSGSSSAFRGVGSNFTGKGVPPFGNIKFKVVITGVASDAGDVATLICSLEDSPYFCQVIPSFTRNKEMKAAVDAGGEKFQVSEFEISCSLANYRQDEPYFAEDTQDERTAGL
ncbi:MAG: PilN domain-containing protein [Phycisphaerae bacterium]|nr:PilN domain-containing protein [Phycisphaerae bacterium]